MALPSLFSFLSDPPPQPGFIVAGIDQSMNHAGMVVLDASGALIDVAYVTGKVKEAKAHPNGVVLPTEFKKIQDESLRNARRMLWWGPIMQGFLARLQTPLPVHIAIEDYPLRAAQRAHQMGEVGGRLKNLILTSAPDVKIRLHGPESVKIAGAGKGDADKTEMIQAAKDAGFDFSAYGPSACEDLSDAYFLAELVRLEVRVRLGTTSLSQLSENMRRVFLRVTKAHPVNLVDRPWITRS